jgi:hypothetical protein
LTGLHSASIALFAKGKVEVTAVETDPIALAGLGEGFALAFSDLVAVLERCEVLTHFSSSFRFKLYFSY